LFNFLLTVPLILNGLVMKSLFFVLGLLSLTFISDHSIAATSNAAVPAVKKPSLGDFFPGAPAWVSRIHGGASLGSDSSPSYELETTQPLWQADDLAHNVFAQGRVSRRAGKWTLNFGSGYRYLAPDATWLLGANVFYDTQINDGHKRLGFGGEAMQSYLTFRTNFYKGITGWKRIESAANYYIEERALNGYDVGIEGPLPYLPWARLFVSHYKWNATITTDTYGVETKLRADLTPNLSLDFGGSADNKDYALFTKIRFSFGDSTPGRDTFLSKRLSDKAFEARDLKPHVLDPVERHNDIVTERRIVAAGSVTGVRVVIRRGN
jgi:hypothetical protein